MARKVVFSEISDDATYKKFTATEQSKLSGVAEGATVGADWSTNVTNKPTSLADISSTDATTLSNALPKSGGTVTGNITMDTGAKIILNGADPSNANEPISLAYFNVHKERSDFQADVDAVVASGDTSAPGVDLAAAAIGQRYIIVSTGAGMHVNWVIASGETVEANDIIEARDDGAEGVEWFVAYDVSSRGEGVLTWDKDTQKWLNYKISGGWAEHGGLSVYTAGNGLSLTGGAFSVVADTTTGGSVAPVVVGANGVGIPIDNSTITLNGSNQLQASAPNPVSTTGFMYTITALDVTNGYFDFPTLPSPAPDIATGGYGGVIITIPGGSGQVNAARSMFVANNPAPDFAFGPTGANPMSRIYINNNHGLGGAVPTLTESIIEGDVLDVVYPYQVS